MEEPVDSTDTEFDLKIQESIAILDRLWLLGPGVVSDLWIDFDEAGSSYRTAVIRNGGKLTFMLEGFPRPNDPKFIRSVNIQIEWGDPNIASPANYLSLLNNLVGDGDNTSSALVAKSLKLIEQMMSRRPNNVA